MLYAALTAGLALAFTGPQSTLISQQRSHSPVMATSIGSELKATTQGKYWLNSMGETIGAHSPLPLTDGG